MAISWKWWNWTEMRNSKSRLHRILATFRGLENHSAGSLNTWTQQRSCQGVSGRSRVSHGTQWSPEKVPKALRLKGLEVLFICDQVFLSWLYYMYYIILYHDYSLFVDVILYFPNGQIGIYTSNTKSKRQRKMHPISAASALHVIVRLGCTVARAKVRHVQLH